MKLQQENEEFTQWKEEDEKAAEKVEIIPTAPTSFADALLRKLNMKDDSESKGSKGEPRVEVTKSVTNLRGSASKTKTCRSC